MSWYWIVLIALGAFVGGFTAGLYWVRWAIKNTHTPRTPQLPHYQAPTRFTQMNPYADKKTEKPDRKEVSA